MREAVITVLTAVFLAALSGAVGPDSKPAYSFKILGPEQPLGSSAVAINERGQVVCTVMHSGGGDTAFLLDGDRQIDPGTLPGSKSATAVALSSNGYVVCNSATYAPRDERAFIYREGKVTDIGRLPGTESTYATGVNAKGEVCGYGYLPGQKGAKAFSWKDGKLTELPGIMEGMTIAWAINDLGLIVGQCGKGEATVAVVWENGVARDLGLKNAAARAVNSHGDIVGAAIFAGKQRTAFLYRDGKTKDLGTLGGDFSSAVGISDDGKVVGTSQTGSEQPRAPFHAFLWAKEKIYDLDEAVKEPKGWLVTAHSINSAGQIAAGVMKDVPLEEMAKKGATFRAALLTR